MPSDISRPLIMGKINCAIPPIHILSDYNTNGIFKIVGPGSGIAPFRGFWQERSCKAPSDPIGRSKLGQMTLFFGCQTKEMILYRSELEKLKEDGVLRDIFLALSREPSIKKVTKFIFNKKKAQTKYVSLLDICAGFNHSRKRKACCANPGGKWACLRLWRLYNGRRGLPNPETNCTGKGENE